MTTVDKDTRDAVRRIATFTPDPDEAPIPGQASPGKSKARRFAETVLPPIVLGIILLGLWYLITYGVLDERRRFLLER